MTVSMESMVECGMESQWPGCPTHSRRVVGGHWLGVFDFSGFEVRTAGGGGGEAGGGSLLLVLNEQGQHRRDGGGGGDPEGGGAGGRTQSAGGGALASSSLAAGGRPSQATRSSAVGAARRRGGSAASAAIGGIGGDGGSGNLLAGRGGSEATSGKASRVWGRRRCGRWALRHLHIFRCGSPHVCQWPDGNCDQRRRRCVTRTGGLSDSSKSGGAGAPGPFCSRQNKMLVQ